MTVNWNRRKYTKEEFTTAWLSSTSIAEVARKLNSNKSGGGYHTFKSAATELGLSGKHMVGSHDTSHANLKITRPFSEILVENSDYTNTTNLKNRLISAKLLEEKCSAPFCAFPEERINGFTGETEKIRLSLDHINGIRVDNRIDNLRLLCYDCHSNTPTFAGLNIKIGRSNDRLCCDCSTKISAKSVRCHTCSIARFRTSPAVPRKLTSSIEEIIASVQKHGSFTGAAKELSVSDNALRKRLRLHGIDPKTVK